MTHTHVGHRARVGYVHCGARLWGHREPKAGKLHALTGGPSVFTALCGEKVAAQEYDDFGFRLEGGPKNIIAASDPKATVTCKRCLRLIAVAPSVNHWTEKEAAAAGDVELPRCIHGVPRNVFCGRCES